MPSIKHMVQKFNIYLILSNLRSIQNTASLFRIADCIGVKKIYLTGTTPTPLDKYKRIRPDFIKISLGSEKISHEYIPSLKECIAHLKKQNIQIIGIEQNITSIDYKLFIPDIKKDYAIILFNEPFGANELDILECDTLIEIPQYGEKESLNVMGAGAIALFRLFDR